MKPSLSIIAFTTLSGAGFGMLAWTGLLAACGLLPAGAWFGVIAVVVALVLASAGLFASTLHLGHPERAWRAFSQWRTSWLSREGVASLVTFAPGLGLALAWWLAGGAWSVAVAVLGVLSFAAALVTVACTAMIYASIKPVRQWHNRLVLPLYLLNALASGGACLALVAVLWSGAAGVGWAAIAAGFAALLVKLGHWRHIDTTSGRSTIESATGLGAIGRVRALDPPHTEENYLLRELGFRVGRRHAGALRVVALGCAYVAPILLLAAALLLAGIPAAACAAAAAVLALAGLFVERWLFFAEATHTVVLYYGRAA
ncbi:MAG TPA: DmsC/YnfH family molybdoenzyme membrane anchor subunit [Acetobacteraceae bacterium]|nr:DmsC/YnfH family molybdoenzyme membrane anchor subunit [Acetobacteraceae bacterium]